MKKVTVHSGQNIYNLAEQYYGTRSLTKLLQDNPQLTDIDAVIPAGTELTIIQFPDNAERVAAFERAGETLSTGDGYVAGTWSAHLSGEAINCIMVDSEGTVWVATETNYLYSWDGDSWTWHKNSGTMTASSVRWIVEDETNDRIYAATNLGVISFDIDTDTWDLVYDTGDGLPSNDCRWIGLASDGTFYVGTDTGLATTSDWISYTNFTSADPDLPSDDIRHGHVADDDTVWLATDAGAVEFGYAIYDMAGGELPSDDVVAIFNDDAWTWIATAADGLVVYDGVNFIVHDSTGPNVISDEPMSIAKDVLNNVMVGFGTVSSIGHTVTRNGLDWRIEISSNVNSIVPKKPITAIDFDARDNVWIGTTDSGVVFYERNNLM
jgi:ligand-binding sensor domain-containing protein/phage tail protein X